MQCAHISSRIFCGCSCRRSTTSLARTWASQKRRRQRWHWCSMRSMHASSAHIAVSLRGARASIQLR